MRRAAHPVALRVALEVPEAFDAILVVKNSPDAPRVRVDPALVLGLAVEEVVE